MFDWLIAHHKLFSEKRSLHVTYLHHLAELVEKFVRHLAELVEKFVNHAAKPLLHHIVVMDSLESEADHGQIILAQVKTMTTS